MHKYQPIFTVLVIVALANLLRDCVIQLPAWQHSIGAFLISKLRAE